MKRRSAVFPMFPKPTGHTDILRAYIKTELQTDIPTAASERAKTLAGKKWQFRCSTRKKDFHPKPVISKGWRRFVKDKRLLVGDKVVFYKDVEGDSSYQIKTMKKVFKLFGEEVWLES